MSPIGARLLVYWEVAPERTALHASDHQYPRRARSDPSGRPPARTGGEPCPAALATPRSPRINHHKRKITLVPREGTGGDGQPSIGAVVARGVGPWARANARLLGCVDNRAGDRAHNSATASRKPRRLSRGNGSQGITAAAGSGWSRRPQPMPAMSWSKARAACWRSGHRSSGRNTSQQSAG